MPASYPYLSVDARYEHVRVDGRVVSQGVLVVAGMRDDGRREILAVEVADTESEATYQELFRRAEGRGLHGVRLVTSDDHAGLRAAIARHFQGASWQRCQVHFARNLLGRVGAKHAGRLAAGLREHLRGRERAQARAAARRLRRRMAHSHPQVARHWRRSWRTAWRALRRPLAHQVRMRTTNGLERLNQELKRRTRVVRIFPNRAACLRLVTALAMEQSEEWVSGRRYLDMEPLGEVSPSPAMAVAQAA